MCPTQTNAREQYVVLCQKRGRRNILYSTLRQPKFHPMVASRAELSVCDCFHQDVSCMCACVCMNMMEGNGTLCDGTANTLLRLSLVQDDINDKPPFLATISRALTTQASRLLDPGGCADRADFACLSFYFGGAKYSSFESWSFSSRGSWSDRDGIGAFTTQGKPTSCSRTTAIRCP